MKVLVVDNNLDLDCWGSADLKRFVTAHPDATAVVRRGPHNDLPRDARGFDRMILSGSRTSCLEAGEWISRLDHLIRETLDAGKPILGVCYGHQALNRVLGGREILRRGTTPEFGWSEIEVLAESPLFAGLPKRFHSYSSHWEEVSELPKGMRLLARSAACAIQACQLGEKPVFGIQFHPEKSLPEAKKSLAEKVRKKETQGLLRAKESDRLFDAAVGDRIFGNFLRA